MRIRDLVYLDVTLHSSDTKIHLINEHNYMVLDADKTNSVSPASMYDNLW